MKRADERDRKRQRRNIEGEGRADERRKKDRESKKRKREAERCPVKHAVSTFLSNVKRGPECLYMLSSLNVQKNGYCIGDTEKPVWRL